jgi:hypothetical protein
MVGKIHNWCPSHVSTVLIYKAAAKKLKKKKKKKNKNKKEKSRKSRL